MVKQCWAYTKRAATHVSEDDKELWYMLEDLPALEWHWPYIAFTMNIVLPGTGTMLAGCMGYVPWNKLHIFIGILQMVTSVFLLGWLWSILWGYKIAKKGMMEQQN